MPIHTMTEFTLQLPAAGNAAPTAFGCLFVQVYILVSLRYCNLLPTSSVTEDAV